MFPGKSSREEILRAICNLIEDDHGQPLDALLREQGKSLWGLKDPELTAFLQELETYFTDHKFVIIVRDARAVVDSYMRNKWGLGTTAYTGALRWLKEVAAQMEFADRHHDRVHILRYEDLITDPEHELTILSEFIGLGYSTDMMEYYKKPTTYHRTRENAATFARPEPKHIDKWTNRLTRREVAIIDGVCGDRLRQMGYAVGADRHIPTGVERSYYLVHQKVIGELQIQYRWRMSVLREHIRKRNFRKPSVGAG